MYIFMFLNKRLRGEDLALKASGGVGAVRVGPAGGGWSAGGKHSSTSSHAVPFPA